MSIKFRCLTGIRKMKKIFQKKLKGLILFEKELS